MGKIDIDTYNTSNDMSSKVELLFLKNMTHLNYDYDKDSRAAWSGGTATAAVRDSWHVSSRTKAESPDLPHGNNNVADSIHLGRIEANIDAVQLKMNDILGDMKRVFDFLDRNTSDDTRRWSRFNHSMLVNRVWRAVDQSLTELKEIFPEKSLTDRKNHDLS